MVVILDDHLTELLPQVLMETFVIDIAADERNLLPDNISAAVRLLEHTLRLRIMREPQGIDAHLVEEVEVSEMVLLLQGDGDVRPVLVAAHAVELHVLSVKEEALVRIDTEVAQTDVLLHTVDFLAVPFQDGDCLVQVGVLPSVPEMGIPDIGRHCDTVAMHENAGSVHHLVPSSIKDREIDLATAVTR